jgi:phage anti-repressor protein
MDEVIDIVALVNDNPLSTLSKDYGSKVIQKIQQNFKEHEQQLFVANFYCYLNYDSQKDFVISLDNIWKWLGYNRINDCKRCLTNESNKFEEGRDYKIEKAALQEGKAGPNLGGAGLNKETILLTINSFKKLCLKSRTDKSDEIHDYYIKLEEIINESVKEQAAEFQEKLTLKNTQYYENLMNNFSGKHVIYFIRVDGKIIKFGYTKDIKTRFYHHKTEFGQDIEIILLYETIHNREFEEMIKVELEKYIIKKKYKTLQTELIQLSDTFTLNDLLKEIERLKKDVNENLVPKLLNEITELKLYIHKLEEIDSNQREQLLIENLKKENKKLKCRNMELEDEVIRLQNRPTDDVFELEREKLEVRKQELDMKYNNYQEARFKNTLASQHTMINGIEMKYCGGILCQEDSGTTGKWLPLCMFTATVATKDGLRNVCKECRNVSERANYQKTSQKMSEEEIKESKINRSLKMRTQLEDGKKKCTDCGILKEVTEYKTNGKYVTGENKYRAECTDCINKKRREQAQAKRDAKIKQQ